MTEPLIVKNVDSYDLDTREQLQVELETYRKYAEQGECEKPQSEENGDTRERLEADIRAWRGRPDAIFDAINGWLDRQSTITERECMEQATTRYIGWDCAECAEGLGKELDARCDPLKKRIVELTAERDRLQAKLKRQAEAIGEWELRCESLDATCDALREQREHWFDEAVTIYRRFYPHDEYGIPQNIAEMVLAKVDELTAEVEKLEHDCGLLFDEKRKLEDDLAKADGTCNTLRASVAGLKLTVDRLNARDGAGRGNPGT